MSSHESWLEANEIPLAGSSLQHIVGIDAHGIEYLGQFVHECDIHIALAVLDDLACLCHSDAGSQMCSVGEYRVVHAIHQLGYLGCGA